MTDVLFGWFLGAIISGFAVPTILMESDFKAPEIAALAIFWPFSLLAMTLIGVRQLIRRFYDRIRDSA